MASATMCIRMDEEDKSLIYDYANVLGMSVSDLVRSSVFEKIEDELDLKDWNEAKAKFEENPVTVPFSEIEKKYL